MAYLNETGHESIPAMLLRYHPFRDVLPKARGYKPGERVRLDLGSLSLLADYRDDSVRVISCARGVVYVECDGRIIRDALSDGDRHILQREVLACEIPKFEGGEYPLIPIEMRRKQARG